MGRPICVRKGGRYRQPRHRVLKERDDQRLRKSCVWVALDRGDYRSNGGCLWLGWTGVEIVNLVLSFLYAGLSMGAAENDRKHGDLCVGSMGIRPHG